MSSIDVRVMHYVAVYVYNLHYATTTLEPYHVNTNLVSATDQAQYGTSDAQMEDVQPHSFKWLAPPYPVNLKTLSHEGAKGSSIVYGTKQTPVDVAYDIHWQWRLPNWIRSAFKVPYLMTINLKVELQAAPSNYLEPDHRASWTFDFDASNFLVKIVKTSVATALINRGHTSFRRYLISAIGSFASESPEVPYLKFRVTHRSEFKWYVGSEGDEALSIDLHLAGHAYGDALNWVITSHRLVSDDDSDWESLD